MSVSDRFVECAQCHKLFPRDQLGPRPTGEPAVWFFDRRPRGTRPGQPGRGVPQSRVGAFPDWCRVVKDERYELACRACGGVVVEPVAPKPLWKAAREAWAEWKTTEGGGEWGKLAPRKLRGK